jgi:hypothetical protein
MKLRAFNIRNNESYDAFKNNMAGISIRKGAGKISGLTALLEKTPKMIRHPFFAYNLQVENIQRDKYFKSLVALTL